MNKFYGSVVTCLVSILFVVYIPYMLLFNYVVFVCSVPFHLSRCCMYSEVPSIAALLVTNTTCTTS